MTIKMRPCRGEADFPLIADLIRSVPASSRHVVDLPWRISSPSLQSGRDAYVWEDDHGMLLGFAAWQIWWASLDFFVRPGLQQQFVETEIFDWATTRFQELDTERGRPLPYWAEYRDDDTNRQTLLLQNGFVLDDDFHYVQLLHPLSEALELEDTPDGFEVRPL